MATAKETVLIRQKASLLQIFPEIELKELGRVAAGAEAVDGSSGNVQELEPEQEPAEELPITPVGEPVHIQHGDHNEPSLRHP